MGLADDSNNNIPVIDLSSGASEAEIAAAIGRASVEWGFFQVTNHGVPKETREKIESAGRKFFKLPLDEKSKVARDEANPLGFTRSEQTVNVPGWNEVFHFTVEEPAFIPASPEPGDREIRELNNRWPLNPPEFRDACKEYTQEMVKLAHRLAGLLCLSLGLPKDRLRDNFKDQTSFLKLNYYPPCPTPDHILGCGPHKDASAITILAQDDVGGLQVKRKSDGEWILVKPKPDAFIVNVGDVFQVWSNDAYHSVEHRVKVNSTKERLSIPFFFDPSHYVDVKPLDELVDKENNKPPKYRVYNYGKFYSQRRQSEIKKLNVTSIHIDQFRI